VLEGGYRFSRGVRRSRDVDIAQAFVAAAFASIVLWGQLTDRLRRHAVEATELLTRAIPASAGRETIAARYRQMSAVLAATPLADT